MDKELPFCECGCGRRVTKKGNRFIHNHHMRGKQDGENNPMYGKKHTPETIAKMSAARLGVPHTSPAQIAADKLNGSRLRGISLSPEHCDAIKKGIGDSGIAERQRGVPRSPEHIAAIKKGQEESGTIEKMRGGNDIIQHHHIYDHNDLSKYTIPMTRSQHMSLHRNIQLLGLEIPHINTGHENKEELKLMKYIKEIEIEA